MEEFFTVATTKLLYEIVYDTLKAQILSGTFQEGELLPSEREIGEQHKVDRTTVRKALKMLVDDQLVVKQAGIGTKVCREGEVSIHKDQEEPSGKTALNGNIGFFSSSLGTPDRSYQSAFLLHPVLSHGTGMSCPWIQLPLFNVG